MGCVSSAATVPIDDVVISIFGIDNSGKTCLLRSLAGNYDFNTVGTVGLGQDKFTYDDIQLTVYDLGGSQKFRSVWQRFFAEIWGFIYVVDAADHERLKESSETLDVITQHKMMKGKPFIIVANKQDKEGAIPAEKLRKHFNVGRNVQFIDAVVTDVDYENKKCNEGVSTAVSRLIDNIIKDFTQIHKRRLVDLAEQKEIEDKERKEKQEKIARMKAEREAMAAMENQDDNV